MFSFRKDNIQGYTVFFLDKKIHHVLFKLNYAFSPWRSLGTAQNIFPLQEQGDKML